MGALARLTGDCLKYIQGNSSLDPLKVLEDLMHGGFVYGGQSNQTRGEPLRAVARATLGRGSILTECWRKRPSSC
jgi:hypothetical protein